MPRILVLYGTTDGHTAKVAKAIGDTLRQHGAAVTVVEPREADPRPDGYDGTVVLASVHAGGYQRKVRFWVRTHADTLAGQATAFVSVCLGILQDDPAVRQEEAAILERFLTATGWRPGVTKIVAGALQYTRYNWLKRWIMRRMVQKAGGDTDTSRDYEYTDWDDLRAFATHFGVLVRERHSSTRPADTQGAPARTTGSA